MVLQNQIDFVSSEGREGKTYNQPVVLQLPTGATWQAANTTVATLNTNVVASQLGNASVAGSSIINRDLLSYDSAAKAASAGKAAFMQATALTIKNLMKATSKFLELDLLYGGGTAGSTGNSLAQTTTIVAASGTTATVTISYGTWAPAIFAGMENAYVDFYNAGSVVAAAGAYYISAVNVVPASMTVGGTLTITGTAGNITTLVALSGTTLDIYWYTSYGAQMSGLRQILTNTGSLFGISATSYSNWRANSYDAGNTQLTFGKLQAAIAKAVNRGLDTEATTYIAPPTFANLVDEQAGARLYDSSYSKEKAENGVRKLEFFSANGVIRIQPHIFMHQGEAMILALDEIKRIGPADGVQDTLPGMGDSHFLVQSPTYASFEVRNYVNQGVLIEAPLHAVLIQNIGNVA